MYTELKPTKQTFGIYCSGSASRLLRLYNSQWNKTEISPEFIFYDGGQEEVFKAIQKMFPSNSISFSPKTKTKNQETSDAIEEIMQRLKTDYLFVFGNAILKPSLINSFPYRLINFHPSLLPSFRGLKAIDQAIKANSTILGNTAHYIDEGIDTGQLIIQSAMLAENFESYEDVFELQLPMFKLILRDLLDYRIEDSQILSDITRRNKPFLLPTKIDNRGVRL
jgi:phosphoribosylglycinamide formyltransferase-1